MSSTVRVEGISQNTSEKEIREFFSFCGKIKDLSVDESSGGSKAAQVTFEKDSAARTALLLDGTQLGESDVHVFSEQGGESGGAKEYQEGAGSGGQQHHEHDIPQEEKPRTRIVAEYLAHGYRVGDHVIQRAIAFDQKNGISSRFQKALSDFDSKYRATERTRSMDDKYQVSQRAVGAWNGLNSYFEQAINTPSGRKIRQFYEQGQKQVLDVHNEAMHLANLRKQDQGGAGAQEQHHAEGSGATEKPREATEGASEKQGLHEVPGTDRTKCNCGATEANCPCEPGKCACANCAKNPEASA